MTAGRLIMIRNGRNNPKATTIYVVAEEHQCAAVKVLEKAFSSEVGEYEDLGPLNESFIDALGLARGKFARL